MPRLFTGLEVPSDVAFALSLKRGGLHGARWIDPENYHVTLRYVGDVDHHTAYEVAHILERFTVNHRFSLKLTHLGAFGGNRPRALYAGMAQNDELVRLQAAQERAFQQIGLSPDSRKFMPHISLARLRGTSVIELARFMQQAAHFEPLQFDIGRFVLFSSRDSVGGGPYLIEQAYDFAA